MKFLWRILVAFSALTIPIVVLASHTDLVLLTDNVRFSSTLFTEGKTLRIYTTVANTGKADSRGVVRFFDGKDQIQGDQPISVVAGKEDTVFVDWLLAPGERTLQITVIPFEHPDSNTANNTVTKKITVVADTDRDGIPNASDPDDDNDKVLDKNDTFPLDRKEWKDTDGDRTGDNKDTDDDNDGVLDQEEIKNKTDPLKTDTDSDSVHDKDDAFPLDPAESLDSDHDGIGETKDPDDDNDSLSDMEEEKLGTNPKASDTDGDSVNDKEDAYPLDPKRARDYDRDGIPDEKDSDADNDGISTPQDKNDRNLGPVIAITSQGKSGRRIVFPGETVTFETDSSVDPDGKIVSSEWQLMDEKVEGTVLETKFPSAGKYSVLITLTDDKGESRSMTFPVLVLPTWLPWVLVTAALLLLILALFFIFSYTAPRPASRLQRIQNFLDTVLKIIPSKKRKK